MTVDVVQIATARYNSKRAAGISAMRGDGSLCTLNNDIDATGAEAYAAELCGAKFDASISERGDAGYDFKVNGKTVEVVWLGRNPDDTPRATGHLIVNPHEPKRWAEYYLVIGGGFLEGYYPVGWISHANLLKFPTKDFGYGERFAVHVSKLTPHRSRQ